MRFPKFTHMRLAIVMIVITIAAQTSAAAPGDLDETFDPGQILWQGFAFPAFKYATAIQPDGKILIGGQFDTVNGVPRAYIARLNANGSLDTTFTPALQILVQGGTPTGEVYDIVLQPNGMILVAGYFSVGGQYKTVVRLDANGFLDPSFNVTTNGGSTDFNHIYRMLLQPDGKIVIGSNGLDSVNGVATGSLARLHPTGALDNPLGINGNLVDIGLFALALQPNGMIIVGGNSFSGTVLVRLNPDGTPDKGFSPPTFGFSNVIDAVALEQDGQILVGGRQRFSVNGTLRDGLIRLHPNGIHDAAFDRDDVDIRATFSLRVDSDGKIAVGGSFTVDFGLFLATFGRLNANGSLDFMTTGGGPDNDVFDIERQPDGKYIVVGAFENFYQGNSAFVRTGVARILVSSDAPLVGKIAFSSGRNGNSEIYLMNPDGSNQTRLTTNPALDYFPSLSSDGTRITFVSNRDGNDEIYVMNANGASQVRLTNSGGAHNTEPAFSPDGSRIVFASARDGNYEIYIMNSDGTGQTRLTTNDGDFDGHPSFSPDGTRIVFFSDRDNNNEIYVMNADGTNQVRLTNNTASDDRPTFAPDGLKIVFRSQGSSNSEIYVMNANGTNPINLTNNAAFDEYPSFSPDGLRIAFMSTRDGNAEIYSMNADGTNQARLTNNPAYDSEPSWSGASQPPPPPTAKMKIAGGNILVGSPGEGLILRSPNGTTCVKIAINNVGDMTTTITACP